MLEKAPYELIKKHLKLNGNTEAIAVCLGDQKPSFGSRFTTIADQFRSLGCGKLLTIDYDGKAEILHNLNYPLPKNYHSIADCVYDGGTSEHVANIGQSLTTMVQLPKLGGLICQVVPMNCYGGSYYGLDPLLLHDFYQVNGFEQLELVILDNDSWRFKCIRLATQYLPAKFVDKTRLLLAKSSKAKTFVLSDVYPKKLSPAPAYAFDPKFNNVPIFRDVSVVAMALYVGKKVKFSNEIVWPSQRNYPNVV